MDVLKNIVKTRHSQADIQDIRRRTKPGARFSLDDKTRLGKFSPEEAAQTKATADQALTDAGTAQATAETKFAKDGGTITGDVAIKKGQGSLDFGGLTHGGPNGPRWIDNDSGVFNFQLVYRTTPKTLTLENSGARSLLTFDQNGIQQGPWIEPTLLNGWITWNTNYSVPAYRLSISGQVQFVGRIKSGTMTDGTTLFTITAGSGCRPPKTRSLMTMQGNNTPAEIYVLPTGEVQIWGVTHNNSLFLDGLDFPV